MVGTASTTEVKGSGNGSSGPNAGNGAGGAGGTPAAGGAAGVGTVLDDPFDVGPLPCDLNPGAGGDACINFGDSAGFYSEPDHLSTNVAPDAHVRVYISSEFTPGTALKQALESDVRLRAVGADRDVAVASSWVTDGLQSSVPRARVLVALELAPAEPLADGWYLVSIPFSAREALRARDGHYPITGLSSGGRFLELETHGLRADFRVGSQPFVRQLRRNGAAVTIEFSERVEAAAPPVSIVASYRGQPATLQACTASDWGGGNRTLVLRCVDDLAFPLSASGLATLRFAEGLKTAAGLPLRGPDGKTVFEIEMKVDVLELDAPAQAAP